jgi:AraC-like DNA-binding protein
MLDQPLPHDVKRALDLLRSDLAHAWTVGDLARRCGVKRRTLEKHFRRFVGQAPLEFLHAERLDQARRRLLAAPPQASVTTVAAACGLNHAGRFAMAYRDRYGESPSETLRWRRVPASARPAPFRLMASSERPTLAVLPFDPMGALPAGAEDLADAIGAALHCTGWVRIVSAPAGRYHLQGKLKDEGTGTLRIRLMLFDRSVARHIWAHCFECVLSDLSGSSDWFSNLVRGLLQPVLLDAEISWSADRDERQLSAWKLSMRALPMVLAADPMSHANALELLEQAVEQAPRDPVPIALAAWCHGLRAGHHFTTHPQRERDAAMSLALRASRLGDNGPLADTILAGATMLAHDLDAAEFHARRALAVDGGSSWGWGRLAWVHGYRGETARAVECCRIARALGPTDPLSFIWAIGIAAAHFEEGRYEEALRWYRRALAEQPKATWLNRFLAPASVLAGHRELARKSLHALASSFPELTITQVLSGLPHTPKFLGRVAEGLADLGMPHA